MSNPSPVSLELSIVLPLGVIANQLMKVEADLRFLSAKASAYPSQSSSSGTAAQVAARLEKIHELLESIRSLVADIETDIEPRPDGARSLKMRSDRDD
ncbi:MAG TPA: hypothetical protein VGI32_14805 [Steroidobacteraceae bacterium]|jgi:hypothetical protein